jgi:diadenosine tetraphosphate (Ap4A) HIT family hydrolase
VSDCRICTLHAELELLPPRERIHLDEHWRVGHGWGSLEGWLVVCALRHVESIDQLDPAAVASLSPLLAAASGALRELVGCERTYVVAFGEQPGFNHLHVHVVPRMASFTDAQRGVGVFGFLQVPETEMVSAERRDRLAAQLQPRIGAGLGLA